MDSSKSKNHEIGLSTCNGDGGAKAFGFEGAQDPEAALAVNPRFPG